MARKKDCRKHKEEFIKLYKEGKSLRDIGKMYNVSKNIVGDLVKEEIEIRPKNILQGKEEEMYQMYLGGSNFSEIARAFNANAPLVARVLRRNYDIDKGERKYSHLSETFKKEYEEGKSLSEISKTYGVSRQAILDYISSDKVKSRSYSETSRLFYTNENYFDVIDTKKAYQLGMIYALGGLYKTSTNYFIDLKIHNDKNYLLLEAIENITDKDDKNFEFNHDDNIASIRVSSKKLYDKLLDIGIKADKVNIDEKYLKHFFDGFFKVRLTVGTRTISVSKVSNYKNMVKDYLVNNLGVNIEKIRETKSSLTIEQMEEINKIEKYHPITRHKILNYINNSEKPLNKWKSYLQKYSVK